MMVLAQGTRQSCSDPSGPLTPGGAGGAGAATPARPPKMHFNELDECDGHNLLRHLLIEYVTLLTNPDSTTLLTRTAPARTAPARAAPAPDAREGGGGGAGGAAAPALAISEPCCTYLYVYCSYPKSG